MKPVFVQYKTPIGNELECTEIKVRSLYSHNSGLTKGKTYNVYKDHDRTYQIFPDDKMHISEWDKKYFEKI